MQSKTKIDAPGYLVNGKPLESGGSILFEYIVNIVANYGEIVLLFKFLSTEPINDIDNIDTIMKLLEERSHGFDLPYPAGGSTKDGAVFGVFIDGDFQIRSGTGGVTTLAKDGNINQVKSTLNTYVF